MNENNQKKFAGIVVGNKSKNTLMVKVESVKVHPKYQKRFKVNKKFAVHTDKEHQIGEKVEFVETRPMSKTKKWKVIE